VCLAPWPAHESSLSQFNTTILTPCPRHPHPRHLASDTSPLTPRPARTTSSSSSLTLSNLIALHRAASSAQHSKGLSARGVAAVVGSGQLGKTAAPVVDCGLVEDGGLERWPLRMILAFLNIIWRMESGSGRPKEISLVQPLIHSVIPLLTIANLQRAVFRILPRPSPCDQMCFDAFSSMV
jgi:hypothetical protein